jgi:predicted transcriptional regulator
VLAEIDRLRANQLDAWTKDNPFKQEYDDALAVYNAYWAKEKELLVRHQKATGDERVQLADQLKVMKMKGDDVRVGRALEEAKKKMKEWQAKNISKIPDADPKIDALEERVAELQAKIKALDVEP